MFSNNVAFLLVPSKIELSVGDSRTVELVKRDLNTGDDQVRDPGVRYNESGGMFEFWTTAPFTAKGLATETTTFGGVVVSCTAPTDGWVADAYGVSLWSNRNTHNLDKFRRATLLNVFGNLDLFGQADEVAGIKLAGHGKCNEAKKTATTEGSSIGGGDDRSSLNSDYEIPGDGTSGSIAVNGEDCFGYEGPQECASEMDITGFAWEPMEGEPGLVRFTLMFAGPLPPSPGNFYIQMTATGAAGPGSDSPRVTTRIMVRDGLLCEGFGAVNPLPESGPAEPCRVVEPGTYEIVRDLSELTGEVAEEIISAGPPANGGGVPEDRVTIQGVEVVR